MKNQEACEKHVFDVKVNGVDSKGSYSYSVCGYCGKQRSIHGEPRKDVFVSFLSK